MAVIPAKHKATIDEAVERLISRAENARGLVGGDIVARVEAALEKYLFRDNPDIVNADIKAFIDEIRADDLCLVIACERGDETAWEALVQQFDPTVKSAARKAASNTEDAEDLASSIWAELYGLRTDADGNKKSKLAYYSGRGSLGGWLRAVTAQLAVDGFRKQAKYVQIEEDREFENLANEAAGEGELIAYDPSPEDLLTDSRTAADVTEALAQTVSELDAEDRLIMKLYYFDELRLKQIADTFGYHEATASRKLARIQSEIRKGVERTLKNKLGWTDNEVKKYLSETAESLGVSLETMFAAITLAVLLQEIWL
ncbi:MAG: sigma-70 family RNA polymerase sigma factor [Acidobacteriota bacterium]|nr:MAG: sigma-70 family RNA polymerase sigma factor [Acidobacteriota bacterium]